MGDRTQAISVCVRVRPRIAVEQEGRTAEQVKEVCASRWQEPRRTGALLRDRCPLLVRGWLLTPHRLL